MDLSIVGEAADGLHALRLIEETSPDIVVLDLALPSLSGLEVLREGSRRSPNTRFVVLSMHGEEAYALHAFRYGASAYVLKGGEAAELVLAVQRVAAGETFVGDGLPANLPALARQEALPVSDRYEMLTHREREVLQLSADGLTSQEIGQRLFISPRTVEKHRENLMAKLELRNQTELVRFALERGFLGGGGVDGGEALRNTT